MDGVVAVIAGTIIGVGGWVLGNVITFGGVTFAAFNFGVLLGAALIIAGLVTVVRGR